jgi:hypothetical protein
MNPERAAGTHVVIDHGNGEFSLLAHLKPGTLKVKVGQSVKAGALLGLCGNSGNSSEAHLHLHVTRAPLPLSADNVPYEFDRFTYVGALAADDTVRAGPDAGERTDQLALDGSVIGFPSS